MSQLLILLWRRGAWLREQVVRIIMRLCVRVHTARTNMSESVQKSLWNCSGPRPCFALRSGCVFHHLQCQTQWRCPHLAQDQSLPPFISGPPNSTSFHLFIRCALLSFDSPSMEWSVWPVSTVLLAHPQRALELLLSLVDQKCHTHIHLNRISDSHSVPFSRPFHLLL